jgi:hypothetical protein
MIIYWIRMPNNSKDPERELKEIRDPNPGPRVLCTEPDPEHRGNVETCIYQVGPVY